MEAITTIVATIITTTTTMEGTITTTSLITIAITTMGVGITTTTNTIQGTIRGDTKAAMTQATIAGTTMPGAATNSPSRLVLITPVATATTLTLATMATSLPMGVTVTFHLEAMVTALESTHSPLHLDSEASLVTRLQVMLSLPQEIQRT